MEKHIVIIEDNQELLYLLADTLTGEGYRVTALPQLNSVEELLELRADAFILDETLPVVNGHIICIILKSKPETRHLPVLLISGDHQLEHKASLCEADGYLFKPFDAVRELPPQLLKLLAA